MALLSLKPEDFSYRLPNFGLGTVVHEDGTHNGTGNYVPLLTDSLGADFTEGIRYSLQNITQMVMSGGINQDVIKSAKKMLEDHPGDKKLQDALLGTLGFDFTGPKNFKNGWETLRNAMATGSVPGVAQAKAEYAKQLGKLTSKLPPHLRDSPIGKELLTGAQDPVKVADHIFKLGESIAKEGVGKNASELGGKALSLVYAQSYSSVKQGMDTYVLPFLAKGSDARKIYTATTGTVSIYKDLEKDTQALVNKYKWDRGAEMDAAGVAACGKLAAKTIKAVGDFAATLGADKEVTDEISAWAGVLTGCVSGIAAGAATGPWGAAAGAVACGVAVITKALVTFFTTEPDKRDKNQLAVFFPYKPPPKKAGAVDLQQSYLDQVSAVASDSERLANILAEYYNFTSYGPSTALSTPTSRADHHKGGMYWRVTNTDRYANWFVPVGSQHPTAGSGYGQYPDLANSSFAAKGERKQPTGFTMVHALTALDKTDFLGQSGLNTAGSWVRNLLFIFAGPKRHGAEKAVGAEGTKARPPGCGKGQLHGSCTEEDSIYSRWYDVNVKAVEHMASIARNPRKLEKAVQFLEGYMLGYKEDRTQNWLEDFWEAVTDTASDTLDLFGLSSISDALKWGLSDYDLPAPFDKDLTIMSETQIRTWVLKNAPIAFETFRRMDEILNFFAAVTMYETSRTLDLSRQAATASAALQKKVPAKDVAGNLLPYPQWWAYLGEQGIPLSFYAVGGGHRGEPDDAEDDDHYHKWCWSNLEGCEAGRPKTEMVGRVLACADGKFGCGKDGCYAQFRAQLMTNKDFCAAKEMAYLRVLSGFSFIHMQYVGSIQRQQTTTNDAIAVAYTERVQTAKDPMGPLGKCIDLRERRTFKHSQALYQLHRHWAKGGKPRKAPRWSGPVDALYKASPTFNGTHPQKSVTAIQHAGFKTAYLKGADGKVSLQAIDTGHRIASLYLRLRKHGAIINNVQQKARIQAHLDQRAVMTLGMVRALLRDEPKQRTMILQITAEILNGEQDFKTSVKALSGYASKCNKVQYKDTKGGWQRFAPYADVCWNAACCPSPFYAKNVELCAKIAKQGIKCPKQCTDRKLYLYDPAIRPTSWPKGCATTPWEVTVGAKPCPGVTIPSCPSKAPATKPAATSGFGANVVDAGIRLTRPRAFSSNVLAVPEFFRQTREESARFYGWDTYLKHLEHSRQALIKHKAKQAKLVKEATAKRKKYLLIGGGALAAALVAGLAIKEIY